MTGARVNDRASEERLLCAIALFEDTDSLNRELLGRAVDQLAGFVLVRARERCEYEKVRHPQPMTGLRDTNGAETRDAWERLIELGELDPPMVRQGTLSEKA
jgi:hypothetical protein